MGGADAHLAILFHKRWDACEIAAYRAARCAYLILEVGDALLRSVGEVSVGLLTMRLPIGSAGLA